MCNFKINWRRIALLFGGWTLVSVIFAAVSYAAAIGENNKEFGFVSALRLNLVQFYHWAILSPLLFRFSRHFPSEFRPLNTQLAQAQLRALKMQLHPHFLFNTLHSISSLVLEDPPKANSMIARLGDFLRLTFENSDQQLVTLKEVTEFLRCYLEIEQVRFGDRLTVAFELESQTLAAQVPHLILQPVVENAVQHAIAPRASPGCIKIEARRLNDQLRIERSEERRVGKECRSESKHRH